MSENIKVGGNIGNLPATVITLGNGVWLVTVRRDGREEVETWDADEPDVGPAILPGGALAYINNHGEIVEVISPSAFVRIQRKDEVSR